MLHTYLLNLKANHFQNEYYWNKILFKAGFSILDNSLLVYSLLVILNTYVVFIQRWSEQFSLAAN
jgi:uncharacterized membrane protein